MDARIILARIPDEGMRNPVPVGTAGTITGVHGRYLWVWFDGTHEAQTMLPEDLANEDGS